MTGRAESMRWRRERGKEEEEEEVGGNGLKDGQRKGSRCCGFEQYVDKDES